MYHKPVQLHSSMPSATCPSVNRPESRAAYFAALGVKDPLRCTTCGKFKSDDAAPEWRCACAPRRVTAQVSTGDQVWFHDLSRAEFDAFPVGSAAEEHHRADGRTYWSRDFELGEGPRLVRVILFTSEPPVPNGAILVNLCSICKSPLDDEHAVLCNACAAEQHARAEDYANAQRDEVPS